MPAKVIIRISKGMLSGMEFCFDRKESLVLGREEDCSIVFPEMTISRYHCLLDINPPLVAVRDLNSLNGTYLNGKRIGKRNTSLPVEEAWKNCQDEFLVKAGDLLSLGRYCEISLNVFETDCSDGSDDLKDGNIDNIGSRIELSMKVQARNRNAEKTDEIRRKSRKERSSHRMCKTCGTILSDGAICIRCMQKTTNIMGLIIPQEPRGSEETSEITGYRKIRNLGSGGMGEVWLVEEEKSGKRMALKLILPYAKANERVRNLFLREAILAGQLSHKNVVNQYKSESYGDNYYILMEYYQGGSVKDFVKNNGNKLSLNSATGIILQTLDGLDYTHNKEVMVTLKNGETMTVQGIVHRDLKPANIFLTGDVSDPTAIVADFGLAKAFETAGFTGDTLKGQKAGSIEFIPRQQIINYRYAKPDVDVWAAAATYYYMLTGLPPKDFSTGKDAVSVVLNDPAVPIRERDPQIPEKLAEVIDAALVEKPQIGIQTAFELKERIKEALK